MKNQEKTGKSGENANVDVRIRPHQKFPAIYHVLLEDGSKRLATKNLTHGRNVYGERLVRFEGEEFRVWDAFRSKLAAAIFNGLSKVPIQPESQILYLGAASGTTASHISDIIGEEGHVYCIEFASRSLRDLVENVCKYRSNMSPILDDARLPERYAMFIRSKIDTIYCDIAQPEQAKVLVDNAASFLKARGWALLAVKAQSIDVTKEPSEVYRDEILVLEKGRFHIEEKVYLEPYDKAHAMILAQALE